MQVDSAQWQSIAKKEPWQNTQQRLSASPARARTLLGQAAQRGVCLLLSEAARPVRFLCTGGVAALFQLGLLGTLAHQGWNVALADIAASLVGAQVNFVLSILFTWRDRCARRGVQQILGWWMAYNASITGTLLLNQLLFLAARLVLPLLLADVLGMSVAAVANFVLMNRLVFRQHAVRPSVSEGDADQERRVSA